MTITINGTTGIAGVDGSAGTPAVQGSDTNTGEFFPAADTIAWTTGGTERMRIDSSGNVGIGTTSPSFKLDVTGGDSTTFDQVLNGGRSANYAGSLLFKNSYWSSGAYGAAAIRGLDSGSSGGILAFYTTTNGGGTTGVPTERARIDNSGNLYLNTTSNINQSRFAIAYDPAAQQGINMKATTANNGVAIQFVNSSNTVIGTISNTTTATAYNTSSDYRLKENIQPMAGALAKVTALKPVTYKWKADGSDGEGFIAHELAEVCPHAVTGEKDAVNEDGSIKPQGIDTSFLVATLTAAIQEQQALIESLTTRIASLEAK